jgi:branched-chain amino acid transport system ATP-binding protein
VRVLEGEKVTKYFGGLAAVSEVDFYVEQGEILGLIGPNGAGKTTLFNLISAALTPKPGVIKYKGKNITNAKTYAICRMGIARTFQTVKIFSGMTVMDNVRVGAFFGKGRSFPASQVERQSLEALDFVGLARTANLMAKDLTLANQKKVEVARALATKPEVLLLDEMMAGLTQTEVTQAMELIKSIQAKGITIVMIEHVMKAIMSVCDRIIVLHHGKKIAEGTPSEIVKSPTVIEVYLGETSNAGS